MLNERRGQIELNLPFFCIFCLPQISFCIYHKQFQRKNLMGWRRNAIEWNTLLLSFSFVPFIILLWNGWKRFVYGKLNEDTNIAASDQIRKLLNKFSARLSPANQRNCAYNQCITWGMHLSKPWWCQIMKQNNSYKILNWFFSHFPAQCVFDF